MGHTFGGAWTQQKLQCVGKYLTAYATIMGKQRFRFAYIDAFAGTGYRERSGGPSDGQLALPELADREVQGFVDGSARMALQVQPAFHRYILVERVAARCAELERLRVQFPEHRERIVVVNADANTYLLDLCDRDWSRNRAVVFLDPYGMQVNWDTVARMAATQAIDLWYLFPLGVAVNRL